MTLLKASMFGDGFLVVPHVRVISGNLCLLCNHHGATVDLEAHALVGSEGPFHKSFSIANQIHRGLTIQQYDLPEIKLDCCAVSLC
jgi:hypothetical protein